MKQEPKTCEWCGKFIVLVSASLPKMKLDGAPYEFYVDEEGRLVKDENDLFLISQEHRCKVVCSHCGELVVIENGNLYQKNKNESSANRIPHKCAK